MYRCSLSSVKACIRAIAIAGRGMSSEISKELTSGEKKITDMLKSKFPNATHVNVEDISGGCGSMYDVQIEAAEFKGKKTILQHRMVNEALSEEIKDMHGLRITTAVSEETCT